MRVLIIGGTGLISTGIVKHLLARGADVTMLNRGKRENRLPPGVKAIVGDRTDRAVLDAAAKSGAGQDAVIDMVCFDPVHCEATLDAFAGKTAQFMFCSTVCTYGVKVPPGVLINESFTPEPISGYGRNKLACDRLVLAAATAGRFEATVMRPSCTYGPGSPFIDNLEFDAIAWDRIARGLPVMCAGDGLGLWVATHRDDVGKAFAYAVANPRTYGHTYNLTRPQHTTWTDYYAQAAESLGHRPQLIYVPADWVLRYDTQRFGLLKEITRFHGAYDASAARRDIPEFVCDIDLPAGAEETFADIRRRGAWRNGQDALYDRMVADAIATGATPVAV